MPTVKFEFEVEGMSQLQEDSLQDMILSFLNSHGLFPGGGTLHVQDDDALIEEVKHEQA